MSLYFDQVLERPDLAQACRKTETLDEVKKVCWSVVETVDGNWPGTASSHAAIACNYARDGIAGQAKPCCMEARGDGVRPLAS